MGRILASFAFALLCAFGGWLAGSVYPAPAAVTAWLKPKTDQAFARLDTLDFSAAGLQKLRETLTPEQFAKIREDAVMLAVSSGAAVQVEHDDPALAGHTEAVEAAAFQMASLPAPAAPGPGASTKGQPAKVTASAAAFPAQIKVCPRMSISNGPAVNPDGTVRAYAKFVNVNSVRIATAPAPTGCLASGFGPRNGRTHKGIDYHAADGGPVLAAGDGTIVEKKYRDDYGNMILIDHGNGVFTRYAHLSNFARSVEVGARVKGGDQLGLMGNTAAYQIPVHLHFELLLGDYANPKGSFGLEPKGVFSYPAAG